MNDVEWQIRYDLAAAFRACALHAMNEQIANHFSVMLPDSENLFLINPRGLHFREITASSLIVCNLAGEVVRGSGELRKVAFHIHARLHLRHPRARCLLHVHPIHLTALSMIEGGRLELVHQNSLALCDRIAYDDAFAGVVDDDQEGDRLADILGERSVLLMGNHGVMVAGETVHEAFDELYMAERTCHYQLTAMSAGKPLRRLNDNLRYNWQGPWGERFDARQHLDAVRRLLDRAEPDYAV